MDEPLIIQPGEIRRGRASVPPPRVPPPESERRAVRAPELADLLREILAELRAIREALRGGR
jgi:hypothetical protein